MKKLTALFLAIITMIPFAAAAEDEISLFDGVGKAVAYIAINEELTIYLWGGKPVAFLDQDGAGGYNVYGFNGKHLGWFISGVLRDHNGNAACATKESMQSTQFESFKSFKEFKPFKAFKELAPIRPFFSSSWSDIPCTFTLAAGGA